MPLNAKGKYFANPAAGRAAEQQGPIPQADGDGGDQSGQVSAQEAGYVPQAPQCQTCEYFQGDGAPCLKVSDPVQAGGWCQIYQAAESGEPRSEQQTGQAEGNGAGGPLGPPGAGMVG